MKCPHCNGETEGAQPACEHCGRELGVTVDSVVVQQRKATIMDDTPWAPRALKIFIAVVVTLGILQYGVSIMTVEPRKAPELSEPAFEAKGPAVPKTSLPTVMPKADLIQPTTVPLPSVPVLHIGFGSRDSKVRELFLRRNGGDKNTEAAVERGLKWLAKHQTKAGSWSCEGHGGKAEHDLGVTGLALLAFLGHGHTHTEKGAYMANVARAVQYLLQQQDGDGRWPGRLYHQAICTMAIVEAYGMTADSTLKQPATLAVGAICTAQQACGGWDYHFSTGRNRGDTSISGWQVMALKSAKKVGIYFSDDVLANARKFFSSLTRYDGAIGYDNVRQDFNRPEYSLASLTAAGLNAHLFAGADSSDDTLQKAVGILLRHFPVLPKKRKDGKSYSPPANMYLWYHAALALCRLGGPEWKFYNARFKSVLLKLQEEDGSWDTAGDRWAYAGGKLYFTSLAILALEVYYRYD